MAIPDWAAKLKGANQAIQKVGERYYLYDVRYGYDREKQRSKIISKTYVGRLDEEKGIIGGKRKGGPHIDRPSALLWNTRQAISLRSWERT